MCGARAECRCDMSRMVEPLAPRADFACADMDLNRLDRVNISMPGSSLTALFDAQVWSGDSRVRLHNACMSERAPVSVKALSLRTASSGS